MSCYQSNARGKRVTQLSLASKCSMTYPHSCPGNKLCIKCNPEIKHIFLWTTRTNKITNMPCMKEIVLSSQFCWCRPIEVVACPSKLHKGTNEIQSKSLGKLGSNTHITYGSHKFMEWSLNWNYSHLDPSIKTFQYTSQLEEASSWIKALNICLSSQTFRYTSQLEEVDTSCLLRYYRIRLWFVAHQFYSLAAHDLYKTSNKCCKKPYIKRHK